MDNTQNFLSPQATAALSETQERIWFLQQIHPDSFGYHVYTTLKISGPLNIRVLEESLHHLINRHYKLQASFPFMNEKPVMTIDESLYPILKNCDLEPLSTEMRESEAQRLITSSIRTPFNLAQGPLVRFTLYRFNLQEYLLLIVLHQIICDIYSLPLLLNDLVAAYQTISASSPLPQVEATSDFEFSSSPPEPAPDLIPAHLAFWKNQLSNLPNLELPIDGVRPSTQSYNGSSQSLLLPHPLYESLQKLSQQQKIDLPLILLGTLQILLYRYTQQSDIAVGYSIPGRNWPDPANRVGCFENFLVLRTKLSETTSFHQLLADLEKNYREAAARQLPFGRLVKTLQLNRDLARTPLFQVLFRFIAAPSLYIQTEDLIFEEIACPDCLALFDLTLDIRQQDDSLHCHFNFCSDLYTDATISRLIGHFQTLLHGITVAAEGAISTQPLLSEAERQQLLVEWNATAADYPKDQCLHQLFEAQALQTPQALAVTFNGRQLTYQQLDTAANQLAHNLSNLGVGSKIPVGIYVEPSVETVVAILGILKAGGCYVPLDPEYPRERISFMLEDTQAPVLLTQQSICQNLSGQRIRMVLLDTNLLHLSSESTEKFSSQAKSNFPACIFYTSGSTGKPKGVPVLHYAITRLVCQTNYVHFRASDRVAQASNLSFDGATFVIWGALLNGGCLVGLPKEVLLSPTALADFLRKEKIDVLFLTPALFHQSAREVPDAFQTIRDLIMGGEVLEPRWVREVLMHGPPVRLLNAYGPTECTTFAAWYAVPGIPPENRSIPIGRPISNATIYILDSNLQPVPVGISGELYIGGDGVALGYLNRPEETAMKFIPNPFQSDPSPCLYRTGDLARFLPDGNVEFLGRIDHQIKIRGFRIEPGEIEEALLKYPGVEAALVILRETESGDKHLLAYLATSEKVSVASEALRNYLSDLLPFYMVPAFFVFLDKFPLTQNGKIDRRALPAPDLSTLVSSPGYVAPRNQIEKQLIEVWERVLAVHPIGVLDDFFSLGGHSLLGARVFTQLEKISGKRVPLYILYQRPTVAQLAEVFRDQHLLIDTSCSVLEPINPGAKGSPLFLISMRDALSSFKQHLGPDQSLYHLISPFELSNMKLIKTGIKGMATHYLHIIRQVQPQGPYLLGGFSAGGILALEITHQLLEQNQEVQFLFLLDPTPPQMTKYEVGKVDYKNISQRFKQIPPGEKLFYFMGGTWRNIKRIIIEVFRRNAVPMPKFLLKFFMTEVFLSMLGDFHPEPVRCPSLLVQCFQPGYKPDFPWSDILLGPLEVHQIEAEHNEVRRQSELWIDYLRKYLEELQDVTFLPRNIPQ